MRILLTCTALLAICTMPALAKEPAHTAQGEKMKTCAQEYHSRNLPKSEYKAFMASCLKKDYKPGAYQAAGVVPEPAPAHMAVKSAVAPAAVAAPLSQKDKMKKCNAEAGEKKLKGDERKSFMKGCLSL